MTKLSNKINRDTKEERLRVRVSKLDKEYINNAKRLEDIGLISLKLDITNAIKLDNEQVAIKQCKVLKLNNGIIEKIELELKNIFKDKNIATKRLKTFNKDTLVELKTTRNKHYLTININRFKENNIDVTADYCKETGIVGIKRLDKEVINDYNEIEEAIDNAITTIKSNFGIAIDKNNTLVVGTITGENIILEAPYREYHFVIQIIEWILSGTKKTTRNKDNKISKIQCKLSEKSKITLRDGKANLLINYAYFDKNNVLRLELEKHFAPISLNEYIQIGFDVDRQDYIKTLQVDLAKRFKKFIENKEKLMKELVNEGLEIEGNNTINDAFKYMLINIQGDKDNFGITDITLVGKVYETMYKNIAPNPKNLSKDFKVLLKSLSPKLVFKYGYTVYQFNSILEQHNLEKVDIAIKSKSINKATIEKIVDSHKTLKKYNEELYSTDLDITVDEILLPF